MVKGGRAIAAGEAGGKLFDRSSVAGIIGSMVMSSPDREWFTIAEAVQAAGCTDGYLRRLLREGRLEGWRAGERAWLVSRDAISELRGQLSTRSNLRASERKPRRKPAKRGR